MRIFKRLSVVFVSAFVGIVCFAGSGSPALASASPTLPAGQELHVLGFYAPKQHATVDVTTAEATVDPATTGLSTVPEAEGAAFELATGTTWVINTNCTLWRLNADGTTTQVLDLVATTGLAHLQACYTLMLNQDGTAYTTADVTTGNEDSLLRFNLSDGSLVAGSVKDTAEIAGLSRDPSTGKVWASVVSDHDTAGGFTQGLYEINLATGELSLSSKISWSAYNNEVAWDMAFDANGILWMLTWGDDSTLVSVDPDAANPAATVNRVAYVLRAGDHQSLGSDAMWIVGNSAPVSSDVLSNTGFDVALPASVALFGLVAGLASLVVARRGRARA